MIIHQSSLLLQISIMFFREIDLQSVVCRCLAENESGMAIRIGFVVLDGRERPKRWNLSIPSRIRGPDVIIILSRKQFSKKSSFNPVKTTNPSAPNDRKDRGKISFVYTKSGFVMVFASQIAVFMHNDIAGSLYN